PDGDRPLMDTAHGIPAAPSLEASLETFQFPPEYSPVDERVAIVSAIAVLAGALAAIVAGGLSRLIGLITNLAYFGRWSTAFTAPSPARLGAWSVLVPVIGAIIVGLMARFGAAAIRGHGIPEVMERVLYNRSRISPKMMILKPLSAAVAIGTGGPFGA